MPFRPDFQFQFQFQGREEQGFFRCPCHGSTFSRDEGDIVFGPAPRPLDALPVRLLGGLRAGRGATAAASPGCSARSMRERGR